MEGLNYTVLLGIFVWLGWFNDIVKFAMSRSLSLLTRMIIIFVYLVRCKKYVPFSKPVMIQDKIECIEYYVHPSSKKFCVQFSLSSIMGFIFNNVERMIQVAYLSLKDLGIYTLIVNMGDNLINMFMAPFIDFFANLFNLKFNDYIVSNDSQRITEIGNELKISLQNSMKYGLMFHQLIYLYSNYLFKDESIYRIFGQKLGQKVR